MCHQASVPYVRHSWVPLSPLYASPASALGVSESHCSHIPTLSSGRLPDWCCYWRYFSCHAVLLLIHFLGLWFFRRSFDLVLMFAVVPTDASFYFINTVKYARAPAYESLKHELYSFDIQIKSQTLGYCPIDRQNAETGISFHSQQRNPNTVILTHHLFLVICKPPLQREERQELTSISGWSWYSVLVALSFEETQCEMLQKIQKNVVTTEDCQ